MNTITFTNTGSAGMVTTQTYDKLNRIQSISNRAFAAGGTPATTLPLSTTYTYNSANQRQMSHAADGSYWVYEYDALGQVTSGRRFWADGTQVAGQQFVYAFDDIGNRKSTGGRASAVSTYTRDYQNKYSQRTAAGSVDILGIANPTASVTVNSVAATRKGEYFHRAVSVVNTGGAQYPAITVTSTYGATESNPANEEVFVPPSTEAFAHDADGNLTSDGRWTYEWDGENRLRAMRSKVGSPAPERRIEFEYDYLGRRIRQTVWNDRDDLQGSELSDVIYLYDRWNLVGELDLNNSKAKLRTYIWGLDLSGSRHAAGGVGGLLKVTDYVSGTTHHFVAYDGNGNVLSLNSGTTGANTARYEYGPFGETIRVTGTMAKKNPFRFSTKFTDNESGLVYYGFRYYSPVTGRWLSRDPIGERASLNLYGMVENHAVGRVDALGLFTIFGRTFMWGDPTWMDPFGAVHTGTPPSQIPPRRAAISLADYGPEFLQNPDGMDEFYNLSQNIHDTAVVLLEISPQNSVSIIAFGESFGGETVGAGGRLKCAAMSAPGIAYLGGKVFKVSGALYKKLKGKTAKEAEEIIRKQCCTVKGGVWQLDDTARGSAIESQLAATEYSGWFPAGQLDNGKFPLVDFQKANNLLSLKSVNTTGSTWLGDMQKHILDLGTRGATVNGNPANMILDIRVQPGGAGAARSLVGYGRQFGVTVIVKEFP